MLAESSPKRSMNSRWIPEQILKIIRHYRNSSKTTMRYQYTSIRTAGIKGLISYVGKDIEEL